MSSCCVQHRSRHRRIAAALALVCASAVGGGTLSVHPCIADVASPPDAGLNAGPLHRRFAAALDPAVTLLAPPTPPVPGAALGLPLSIQATLPNILVNDPTGQVPFNGNTQMEPSLAANGDTLVCVFTDSEGFWASGTLTGFAVSFDAGHTWFDAGSLPRAGTTPTEQVYGDPTIVTDGAGRWYCVSVYDIGNGVSGQIGDLGLVLHTGSFLGTHLAWSGPRLIAGGGSGDALDSPHAAIDPARDRIYVTYTNTGTQILWGQIEVLTLGNHGASNLRTTIVQPQVSGTNNSGASVAVGPDGEVYIAYESGLLVGDGLGPAFQMVARSLDEAVSFSTSVVAGTVVESWLSGPPGFNREDVFVEYPSLAVDRSSGPHRGRVYLAWHDGVPRDFSGTPVPVAEVSGNNDSPGSAQVLPVQDHIEITGALDSADYQDWYRFQANAGEHVRFVLRPISYMRLATHLWCANPAGGGADTLLAGSMRKSGEYVFFLFTIPTDGEYLIQIERAAYTGTYIGWLRKTTFATPAPAIDHRDVVVVSSPNGRTNWSPKLRVNDDTGWTDQAFPAIVVDGDGGAHVTWYDRRFDPRCRARADLMLSSSFDGGATFAPNARVTTVSSSWQVPADAIPNFGDSFRPLADGDRLFPVWADGRLGSPDVMVAPLRTSFDVEIPAEKVVQVGEPVDLNVEVRNETPYDGARFTVLFDSDHPALPDQAIEIGPFDSGTGGIATYSPTVGDPIGSTSLTVVVTSDRSATTRSAVVDLYEETIAVRLSDFTAHAGAGGVDLAWNAADAAGFHVERAPADRGPFTRLTTRLLEAGPGGRYEFHDASAPTGEAVCYRLIACDAEGGAQVFGPYAVRAEAPRAVALLGARPNPFNPTTTIRYELPRAADVTLRVLDVRGRIVDVLLAGDRRPAGVHSVRWDGRSTSGSLQPSGVYVAELSALGTTRATRIVLLR